VGVIPKCVGAKRGNRVLSSRHANTSDIVRAVLRRRHAGFEASRRLDSGEESLHDRARIVGRGLGGGERGAAVQVKVRAPVPDLVEPPVLQGLAGTQPVAGVGVHHLSDQFLGVGAHALPLVVGEVDDGCSIGRDEFRVRLAVERLVPTQHHVQRDAGAEHVDLVPVPAVDAGGKDFGGY
jgi:hypothetical protein